MTSMNCPAEAGDFARGNVGSRRSASESSARRTATSEIFETDICDNWTGVDQPGKKITRFSTTGMAPRRISFSAFESLYQGCAMWRLVATNGRQQKWRVPHYHLRRST